MTEKESTEYFEDKLTEYLKNNEAPIIEIENSYVLVKENGQFKVYMNYGLPFKIAEFEEKMEDLLSNFQFNEALLYANQFYSKNEATKVKSTIEKLEEKIKRVTNLNKSITIGSIEFTPLKIEIKEVDYFIKNWNSIVKKTTQEKYFVLTYKLRNISKAQVFSPRQFTSYSNYNFIQVNTGNKMDVANIEYGAYIDQEVFKLLQPNEEIVYHAVCYSPANENANNYLWNLQLRVSNQEGNNTNYFLTSFTSKDFTIL
jgi:hypothetical protein